MDSGATSEISKGLEFGVGFLSIDEDGGEDKEDGDGSDFKFSFYWEKQKEDEDADGETEPAGVRFCEIDGD